MAGVARPISFTGAGGAPTSPYPAEDVEGPKVSNPGLYAATLAVSGFVAASGRCLCWSAWERAARRRMEPAAEGRTAFDIVMGSPLTRIKEDGAIHSLRRVGYIQLIDCIDFTTDAACCGIGVWIDATLSNARGVPRRPDEPYTYMGFLWGSLVGQIITFPLSLLAIQLRHGGWAGWANLLPVTTLGRQYWRSLPAKLVDSVVKGVFRPLIADLFNHFGGKEGGQISWLFEEIEEDTDEGGPRMTFLERTRFRAHRWATSHVGPISAVVLSALIEMPALMVFYQMTAEPGRFESIAACTRHIWSTEGWSGFYRELPLFVLADLIPSLL